VAWCHLQIQKTLMGKLSLRILHRAAIVLLIAAAVACSTKKNTFIRRAYHNLSAHYNTYWNGNESLKDGVADMNKNVRDNYTRILTVANFGTDTEAARLNSAMDRAIAKASIVIQAHSMVFNKRERVKWIDDSYMLIGKAYFYKHDFTAAKRTFDFVMRQYNYNPIQYDAMLWQARTLIQQKKYSDAGSMLDLLQSKIDSEKVPYKDIKEIPLVYADYFILQKNYSPAKAYLIKGIELNKNKKIQARLYFILGQIADKEKNQSMATEYYSKVIKSSPSYEMAFNARINMANSFDINTGDKRAIEKDLTKMSKEFKNKDFRDQIYYALAQLAFKENNDTLGIHYLRLSVAASVKNDFQKTTSALKLADIYFERQNYRLSQSYYDSTMQFLPKDYPNYDELTAKTATLTTLVTNLEIVQTQDSLQKLAALPAAELVKVIDRMIEDFRKDERLRKEKEAREQLDGFGGGNLAKTYEDPAKIGGGGWYFYNTSAMSFGYTEFLKKWGRRKLEDNWRLSNKRPVYSDETVIPKATPDSIKNDSTKAISTDPLSRKTYLQNIPLTPEMMQASNDSISTALFNLGFIYQEGLGDIPKSVAAFEELLKRYPKDKNALKTSYQLYRTYKALPDSIKADVYRQFIVNNYPESDYARIITDPNYNVELQAKKNRVSTLYSETYRAFTKAQYKTVIIYSNEAIATYKDKDLIPKFEYLRALSLSKTENPDSMLVALNKLVKAYPSSEITPLAMSILGSNTSSPVLANFKTEPLPTGDSLKVADTLLPDLYSYLPNSSHFYVILLDDKTSNVSAIRIRISDFITRNFSTDNLSINTIVLDGGWQMVTVSSFRNMDKGMTFYQSIKQDTYVFAQLAAPSFKQFIISTENYPVFYRDKNADGYLKYFNRKYLQK
jgi:tetratricopeptide (TPR) repeat protein